MDAAFLVGVLLPPPAAGPLGLARHHRPCARRAARRRVAVVEQLVIGHFLVPDVVPDAVQGPVGEWVQLDDAAVLAVELDLRDVAPAHPLLAPEARDPCVQRRELALQRLDLAARAAPPAEGGASVP